MKGIHNIKRSYELRKFQHYKFKYQETSHYPQTSHDSISTKIDIHEINKTKVDFFGIIKLLLKIVVSHVELVFLT